MSDEYKRFLLTILASFLGCLVALCLYGATIKPTFSPPPINPYYQMQRFDHGKFYKKPPCHKFKGEKRGYYRNFKREKFHKNFDAKRFDKKDFEKRTFEPKQKEAPIKKQKIKKRV